nr:hypothetical protein [Tanacetum cinerariifolium]
MMKQLEELQHIKNLDLLQNAKIRWAVDADENSKFFHRMFNSKFARTRINGIHYNGSWISGPSMVISHIYNFHKAKFEDNLTHRPRFTSNLFKKISESDGSILDAPFSSDEIKNAVWDCGGGKAPDPDGFTFKFIKRYWDTIGKDFIEMIKMFEIDSHIPRVIARRLANRLLQVIHSVVCHVRTAYIKWRHIIDGPLMVNETISWAMKKNERLFVLKVDFKKAFDSLDWKFLDHIMEQKGFSVRWRKWIHGCLDSTYASVLINGSPTKEFKINLVLRQVDPLSPFLCILAAEALHVSLQEAKMKNVFEGVKINVHTWRLYLDRLPTRCNLDSRGIDLHSSRCPVCDGDIETAQHLFIDCPIASELWRMVIKWWKLVNHPQNLHSLLSWSDTVNFMDTAKTTLWFTPLLGLFGDTETVFFYSKPPQKDTLGDDVKIFSHAWIMHRNTNLNPNWLTNSLKNEDMIYLPTYPYTVTRQSSNGECENLLDINDSDLPLTPVLRPCNKHVRETFTITSTQDGIVQVWEVKKKPVRIILGPAGIVQLAKIPKQLDIHEGGDDSVLLTQEYMKQVVEDVREDEDFNIGPWVGAIEYVKANGGIVSGCIGDIKTFFKSGKLEQVVRIIKSCSPNALGDLKVTVKDLYVLSHNPSMNYLNITKKNVVKVSNKDFVSGNGSGVELHVCGNVIGQEDLYKFDEEALDLVLEEEARESRAHEEWLEKCRQQKEKDAKHERQLLGFHETI